MIYTISNTSTTLEWGLKGEERIVQNVLNLLRTKQGEVPFMREMGVDPEMVDNTLPFIRAKITEDITELVAEYEPRAKVLEVNLLEADDTGSVVYEVKVEV